MLSLRRSTQGTARKIEGILLLLIVSAALAGVAYAQQSAQKPAPKTAASAANSSGATKPTTAALGSPQKLPLRRVVLYKSGIGYFEHDGHVRGNEDVEIDLTSGQLNDVLKSLTALDFSGGRIVGASYNSQEPAGHQLNSLPVPVAQDSTLPSLLRGLRGARLEVHSSAGSFAGRLLSVEQKSRIAAAGAQSQVDQISLLDDAGNMRSFILESGTTIRFADRDLEQELARALGLLDSSHQEDTRHLVLSTAGTGERQIRVSYISEVPVWKTTYRIVLPGQSSPEGSKPLLQGWAVVDNTVGEDWTDVELSLASGAPQSFIQQLSQPYYMQRPTVAMPRGVLLSPQTHGSTLISGTGSIEGTVLDPDGRAVTGASVRLRNENNSQIAQTTSGANGRFSFNSLQPGSYNITITRPNFKTLAMNSINVIPGSTNSLGAKLEVGAASVSVQVEGRGQQIMETQATSASNTVNGRSVAAGAGGGRGGPGNSSFEGLPNGNINITYDGINNQCNLLKSRDGSFALNDPRTDDVEEFGIADAERSIVAAQGSSLGDLFEYKLKDRVTIRKNQSALVPIIQTEIPAEKVALWNVNLRSARPLRALWLTNSSALVLDGGSFDVIEDGAFAGEGLIESIHPGEKRLVSYAADLAMQVVAKPESAPEQLTHIRVARGILIRTVRSRSKTVYTIRNEDTSPRTLILEQPIRQGWKLAEGLKPEEESATAYRFRIEVKPKEAKEFVVEEDSPRSTDVRLDNLNQTMIEAYVSRRELTPELEKFLRGILAQKDAIAKLNDDLKEKQDELESIGTDQNRVRENLQALKGTPEEKALAQRYVSEMNDQETRLGTLKTEITDLQAKLKQARQDLDDTIEHFTFDEKMNEE